MKTLPELAITSCQRLDAKPNCWCNQFHNCMQYYQSEKWRTHGPVGYHDSDHVVLINSQLREESFQEWNPFSTSIQAPVDEKQSKPSHSIVIWLSWMSEKGIWCYPQSQKNALLASWAMRLTRMKRHLINSMTASSFTANGVRSQKFDSLKKNSK